MRGAASAFPEDRVKAFEAMHAEARRIQERVKYARNIEAARLRRVSSLLASDSEVEEECLEMDDDPDEWWREMQDGNYAKAPAPKALKPRNAELTPDEATEALLRTFRPLRESVAELKRLLDSRADPNAPFDPNDLISPLQNVMTFAPREHVSAMRDLLLERGAVETKEDKHDWLIRQDSDLVEDHCTRAFYEDDRHLSPVGAAMER